MVFVLRRVPHFLERELKDIGGNTGLGSVLTQVLDGHARILQLIGHNQPIGIVDPDAVGALEAGLQGVGVFDCPFAFPRLTGKALNINQVNGAVGRNLNADVSGKFVP